jgi:hypothetical protein
MKSDAQIRDDVIEELRWDPQITEPDAIGVAMTDGAVALTGSADIARAITHVMENNVQVPEGGVQSHLVVSP